MQKNNNGIEKVHHEIEQSNAFLDSILQTNEITNSLIEDSNYLLEEGNSILEEGNELMQEGNELTRISNYVLAEIHNQIQKTGYQLTEALENIGNAIIIGFNETLEKLDDIQRINEHIAEINE